jgi:rhamnose transport system permease protein
VILTSRFSSARADNGTGLTLVVVTIALFGGVDINGGKGTIPGVVLAAFTLALLEGALRLAGVSSAYQNVAVGFLLIVSVIVPGLARRTREIVGRVRMGGPPSRGSVASGEIAT